MCGISNTVNGNLKEIHWLHLVSNDLSFFSEHCSHAGFFSLVHHYGMYENNTNL